MADDPFTDPDLSEKDRHHLAVMNEVAKRVHTVMTNYATVLGRNRTDSSTISADESLAIINGGISAVAILVARMHLTRAPMVSDMRTPEEYFADVVKEQFINTYREVQAQDAVAALKIPGVAVS